ncbi:MAG: hypothetical protein ABI613_04455 [Gemmatimonadota bacterium]
MKSYWFKIVLGALVIFIVGMLVVTATRKARNQVHLVSDTSEPINIPIPFGLVPFKLNGNRLGSVQRLTLLRDTPKGVSGIRVIVKLADPVSADQLKDCFLVVDDVQHINGRTTFRCQNADTAGMNLVRYGEVSLEGSDVAFPLLLPQSEIENLRSEDAGDQIESNVDSVTSAAEALADSIHEINTTRADSIRDAAMETVDSIREAARELADSVRQLKTLPPPVPPAPRTRP